MAIEITADTDPHGLKLFDSNEQRQLSLRTDRPVTPVEVPTDLFCFPVDTSYRIETASIVFDHRYLVNVHAASGQSVAKLTDGTEYVLDDDVQFVGLDGPMKLYCRVDSPGTVEVGLNTIQLTFDEPVEVEIGARSLHKHPAGSITTPDDPASMMRAISAMASAMKTDTPERSWPTLRGHPPLIERGDELDVRTESAPLDTGVSIEVSPQLSQLYSVAPLSFYLSAPLVEGDTPAIHTESTSIPLRDENPFADDVARVLKHVFFLDCLVRTEGVYRYDLYERKQVEPHLPWDLEALYDESLSTRLEAYLEVPYELIEPHVPRWPLTAHVPDEPSAIEVLPFVVNELGIVRPSSGTKHSIDTEVASAATTRTPTALSDTDAHRKREHATLVRSARTTRRPTTDGIDSESTFPVVEPDVTDESIEHAWFGELAPQGASKATIEGYRNQLDRKSRTQHIDILVVCNDARMLDEHDLLDETYGSRELLPFDVTSRFGVSTDELATLLSDGGYDFLHYIGHATDAGLECSDGDLDVRTLESVDLGVFFLNACHSYEQGLALAQRGAFGGVATLGDIINEHAVDSGASLAKLLNLGFPLRGALEIISEWTVLGEQYLIVGDGSTDIAQSDGGAPTIVSVEPTDDPVLSFRTYPAKEFQIGSVTSPNVKTIDEIYLLPMHDVKTSVSVEQLRKYLTWIETPLVVDGQLRWNTELGLPTYLSEV
ncbi:hypothetical protein [Halovivax gelatinilyticus]|uniref:hypothetical protein n=1 Tax=Halovivax gelatinilyticus TaxID=2961597 RepID=UPI0020CA6608|nr:hypothetical protein [Halovivax gelatinilyticus]